MSGKITLSKENVMNQAIVCLSPAGVYPAEVTRKFNDLDMYIRIIVADDPEKGIISFVVRDSSFADALGGMAALFNAAIRNTGGSVKLMPMADILGPVIGDLSEASEIPLYVLTNKKACYGAAGAAVRRDLLREACRKHGAASCFVIPSSVHEVIVLPCVGDYEDRENYLAIADIIREVNANAVPGEERLGDHAYIYDCEADSFSNK